MSYLPNLIIGTAIASYTLLETFTFEVEEKTVFHPDIPENFSGVRIAFMSDIHHGVFMNRQKLKNVIDKINNLQPHLLLLGGDNIQSKLPHQRQLKYLDNLSHELKKIKAPLGKYGVLGNHDHDEVGALETNRAMNTAGVKQLDNKAVWIWKGFQRIRLGGVGDLWFDQQNIDIVMQGVKKKDYTILLSHQPNFVDTLQREKIDLMLTGHTHGGQTVPFANMPFNLGHLAKKNRIKGWMQVNKTQLLISRGLGVEFPYIRLLNQPQIHLITLQKSDKNMVL